MPEPAVPLLKRDLPPAEELMAVSQAMRQAAVDAAHLPPGLHFWYERTDTGQGAAITIKAGTVYGVAEWAQSYQQGRRITVGGGITF